MDIEVLQKYKAGGGGDYSLVYKTEGKDDPYGDMTVSNSEELSNEIAINLSGEVTLATTMDNDLGKIFESYGGDDEESSSLSSYVSRTPQGYESSEAEDVEGTKSSDEPEEE